MRRALLAAMIAAVGVGTGLAIALAGGGGSASTDGTRVLGQAGPRAHPQAIEPTPGLAARTSTPNDATPLGDPTAHAPSLAQVKRELKLLNLCGGTTNPALAQPLVQSTGPGFTPDPGTIQDVGALPVLTSRLDSLGRALGVTIYGISGYRTPAHSVAVGGFADDPHTKGLAEDIGVNSLLRSSASQITEAQLARFGLYRPFDPSDDPSNTEVNHVQLIPAGGPLSLGEATAFFNPDPRCR